MPFEETQGNAYEAKCFFLKTQLCQYRHHCDDKENAEENAGIKNVDDEEIDNVVYDLAKKKLELMKHQEKNCRSK